MANYYFCTTYGNATKALSHSSYILAQDKYDYKEDEILYCDSKFPSWAQDENEFWKAVSDNERANGRGYREFRFSLPNELPLEENMNIVDDFIKNTLKDNFYYTAVIHNKETNDFDKKTQNIHCHLMFNERKIDDFERDSKTFFKRANTKEPQNGGAKKTTEFNSKEKLLELRKDMEILINSYYEKNGFDLKISCETLKKQKEMAENEGDNLKAEFLDRDSISINSYLLKKPIEKMTEEERNEYETFVLNKEIRDIKQDIYNNAKLEAENKVVILNKNEIINNKSIEEINVFDKYISNEKNILEIEKEISKSKEYIDNIEYKTLFTLDKDSYNIFRNKELLEKELFVMDNYENKNEMYFENRSKLEEKIFNYETALEIKINEIKENSNDKFENQKHKILTDNYDRISSLEINKLSLIEENKELIRNDSNNDKNYLYQVDVLEKSFDYNFKTFVSNKKELFEIEREISKIENQLIKENLKGITINRMTNGEHFKIENQKTILKDNISRCEDMIKNNLTKDISFVERDKEINIIKMNKLIDLSEKVYSKIDKDMYNKTRDSIEIKLKEKLIVLKSEKETLNNIVSINKSNFINSDVTKEKLNISIDNHQNKIMNLEYSLNTINSNKNQLDRYYSNNRIEELAYTKLLKGENIKLRDDYKSLENKLNKIEDKIQNSNIFEKIGLNKEKKSLENSLTLIKEKYNDMYKQVDQSNFKNAVNDILESKQKAFNGLEKLETNIKENIKNTKFELYSLKAIKNELYPYKGIESKQENINFNKLIDHAKTGGGGQEKIESFFDDLERKSKSKGMDFEI